MLLSKVGAFSQWGLRSLAQHKGEPDAAAQLAAAARPRRVLLGLFRIWNLNRIFGESPPDVERLVLGGIEAEFWK